jgi:Stress responsive A/B Barrel Domain
MFFHVVMMRLTDADDAFLSRVRHYEERIRRELPYVRDYMFGRNIAVRAKGLTWTVIGTFDLSTDHDRYQVSALHQEMKAFMAPHIADIAVCDFDSAGGK